MAVKMELLIILTLIIAAQTCDQLVCSRLAPSALAMTLTNYSYDLDDDVVPESTIIDCLRKGIQSCKEKHELSHVKKFEKCIVKIFEEYIPGCSRSIMNSYFTR